MAGAALDGRTGRRLRLQDLVSDDVEEPLKILRVQHATSARFRWRAPVNRPSRRASETILHPLNLQEPPDVAGLPHRGADPGVDDANGGLRSLDE